MTISLNHSSPAPSSHQTPSVRWLAVFALALGGFGIGTTEFVAMGLLPDIAASLHITEPTAGHVISAYALGVVVGAPLIAALTARMPRKTLLLGLMAVFTLGNLASMFAPTYETLIAARFIAGLPHGAFFGIAALVAAHLMGPRNRAKAVAHVMTGLTVATVDRRADGFLARPGPRLAQRLRPGRRRRRRDADRASGSGCPTCARCT